MFSVLRGDSLTVSLTEQKWSFLCILFHEEGCVLSAIKIALITCENQFISNQWFQDSFFLFFSCFLPFFTDKFPEDYTYLSFFGSYIFFLYINSFLEAIAPHIPYAFQLVILNLFTTSEKHIASWPSIGLLLCFRALLSPPTLLFVIFSCFTFRLKLQGRPGSKG